MFDIQLNTRYEKWILGGESGNDEVNTGFVNLLATTKL
jgi:hypothetical protein